MISNLYSMVRPRLKKAAPTAAALYAVAVAKQQREERGDVLVARGVDDGTWQNHSSRPQEASQQQRRKKEPCCDAACSACCRCSRLSLITAREK